MRKTILFNDNWLFNKQALSFEEVITQSGETIKLPHTWNAIDGQDGGNDYYRGTCWYTKSFERPLTGPGDRVYLEFQGAAMTATVYVNGVECCRHEDGYSTFRCDITDLLSESNNLAIEVNNEDRRTIYPQKADFTFYGGIYRDVNLIIVPETHFALDYYGSNGIKVTPKVDLEGKSAVVTIEAWTNSTNVAHGATDKLRVSFELAGMKKTGEISNGYVKVEFDLKDVRLWNGIYDPYLYEVTATLENGDSVCTRFGCRQFEVDPEAGFILNGESYPLRGVSRHQDYQGVGNVLSLDIQRQDMEIIKEIGATTIRLAHYQHSQEFYDLCDENGIVVWAEIPYITMHMKEGRSNTLFQMQELVVQNYNHPSIVVWGLSNEITAASVVDEDLLENHRLLNELCHKLDSTRLTTLANVFMLETESPLLEIPDINSYNLYFGWYLGELEQNDAFFDAYHQKYPDRCIGFSEYGADANPKYQSSNPEKGDYTETYQVLYHEHMLKMIEARPWLWATHVWNLFDFAADGRDEGGKNGLNQKGLVTIDRKLKKDAFYLYKAAWNKEDAFVHLCGRRYEQRVESVTSIKVFSNLNEVSLFVDGVLFETKVGKSVFDFEVPINGEHIIEARASEYIDTITIKKVAEPNPEYVFLKSNSVVNWFDGDTTDPSCFSVADTVGELRSNPEAKVIMDAMMDQMANSRGDVAGAVKDNPALIRMMERITLISLLKQAGSDEETIKHLNRILQNVKK